MSDVKDAVGRIHERIASSHMSDPRYEAHVNCGDLAIVLKAALASLDKGHYYERGRADERAAIVRWLRGCTRPDCIDKNRAAGIENGDHIAWAQRSAAADTRGRGE